MRTMTKERKKEGPRLGHKGRADAKASRQLLLLCIPAIIGYMAARKDAGIEELVTEFQNQLNAYIEANNITSW